GTQASSSPIKTEFAPRSHRSTDEFHPSPPSIPAMTIDSDKRWIALYVLCLGSLMIVLDATTVNVALPSIQAVHGCSHTPLALALFHQPAGRAKAMGVFGFVSSGGGTIGVLLGGVLTDVLNWHWIFLVNLPVGIAVFALCLWLLPGGAGVGQGRLDVAGAVTVTASLMIAVYAIVNGNQVGWLTARTLGLLAASAVL